MTSSEIRQSFLDFFKSKQHTIVPSSSLMPDSPNLLFTNAGMNQFVPIFLGQVKCPYNPPRAADTQKCIRAGGKHNDLDDVGLDTYHHTFFEMLGNWSFGDYFKKEAIEWAWELVTETWKFPKNRLYATVYSPDKSKNDPSDFDQEAYDYWAAKFSAAGLDPKIHIVYGNKKDNFWMMGETGPCGPCSELHVDLTPAGDTKGSLVNKGDPRCIEIWNLVFIQFNANPDGTFSPLPAKHVDTGMGFERATSIIQCTKKFTDFTGIISNYETDIFRPIFDTLEKLSGKKYSSTLPPADLSTINPQQSTDIAFRVIADHIRTLSFAIADGIQPGNTDRNYVLRRILRRAVRYGRSLGFHEPFFYRLVNVLADTMGDVFPELRYRKQSIIETVRAEEEVFNRTLDVGLGTLENITALKRRILNVPQSESFKNLKEGVNKLKNITLETIDEANVRWMYPSFNDVSHQYSFLAEDLGYEELQKDVLNISKIRKGFYEFGEFWHPKQKDGGSKSELVSRLEKIIALIEELSPQARIIEGSVVFKLYDTYGFPLDLTELMARERGLTIDKDGFEKLMEEQRARARAAQKKTVIKVAKDANLVTTTQFEGYDQLTLSSRILKVLSQDKNWAIIVPESPFYAEMGGQVGDTGVISSGSDFWRVVDTKKHGLTWLHIVESNEQPPTHIEVSLEVDMARRNAIQRHHTVTHLLHWALHEVVSREASQKGSFVGPDKLTFDFNSAALTPAQVSDIEKLVNERILENAGVSWTEVPYADVKSRKDVMQFFGDKYGDRVRVVQIGGHSGKLDGYSMELCGGTHTRATGEIGLFRIVGESAVAAGVRRIEAVAGLQAYQKTKHDAELIGSVAGKINTPVAELEKKIDALLAQQKELEKSLRAAKQKEAAGDAKTLLAKAQTINGIPAIITSVSNADGDTLQTIADALKSQFKGVIILGGAANGAVSLVAAVSPDFTSKVQAGKIIQAIAPIVGGKGGGKPDNARGGGKDTAKLDEALAKAKSLLG